MLDELEPSMREAFLSSVDNLKSNVSYTAMEEALKAGDIERAARAINLDSAAFRPMTRAYEATFESGGEEAAKRVPKVTKNNGSTALFRFDVRHPSAEQDLRQSSSTLITNISEDQRASIRTALADGIAQGRAPRRTALDIVGRVNPVTLKREGGIIGLTSVQAGYVESMRVRLLSGDPDEMKKVLEMGRRDKRFDATIKQAIRDGKPVTLDMVAKMTTRYSDRLLQLRGETIARTETMTAFNKGQMASMHQAIAEGRVSAGVVVKQWHAFIDGRTRYTHRELNNEIVGINDMFETARGRFLAYPGDPHGGVDEIVNCFAPWSRISPAGLVAAVAHEYSGDLIELSVGGDVYLSVTPNHPILTQRGWVPAGHVVEGDKLVNRAFADLGGSSKPDVGHVDPRADELYDAAKSVGASVRARRGVVNFHGHVPSHDIDVITLPGELRGALNATLRQAFGNITLAETDISQGVLTFARLTSKRSRNRTLSAHGLMGFCRSVAAFFGGSEGGAPSVSLRNAWRLIPKIKKARGNGSSGCSQRTSNGKNGVAVVVKFLDAVKVLASPLGVSSSSRFALNGVGASTSDLRQPQIVDAAFDQRVRDADARANTSNTQPLAVKNSDFFEVLGASSASSFHRADGSFTSVAVSHIRRVPYEGKVFDFQTQNGLVIANNIVAHNCRCWMETKIDFLADLD
ncbi:phage minor head protein [Rhizobium sp. 2MFCol3.1]|uniref:phage minor head protein n=1 Tax=Rhizobium sp. 2MFCol3.1 TaxID=1246459 RepID=UPI00035D5547|nr:phage minor head protein [Rhizobium sp. 2MFCol3.1]